MDSADIAEILRRHGPGGESWAAIAPTVGYGSGEHLRSYIKRRPEYAERRRDAQKITQEPPSAEPEGDLLFPDLRHRADEEVFATRYLDLVIEQQELEASQRNQQDVAHVEIQDDKPVGVVLTGDWHVGNHQTDHGALKEHLRVLRETPGLYHIGMGDYADWFIGSKARLAVTEQQFKPAQQRVIAKDLLLRKAGPRGLACLAGNHCWFPTELTGEDPVADIAHEAGKPYLGYGGVLFVRLGDVEYKFGLWHSYPGGSAINPGNNNRRLRADYEGLDVNCLGHYHFNYEQSGTTREGRDFVDLRSGSFKVRDRYAEVKVGAKGGDPRMPLLILWPHMKKMWHFRDSMDPATLSVLDWLRQTHKRETP